MKKEKEKQDNHKHGSLISWGPWKTILAVAVIFIVSEIVASVLIGIYPALKGMSGTQANNWLTNSVYAQFAFTVVVEAIVIGMVAMLLKFYKSNFKSIGLKGYPTINDLAFCLSGFGIYFVVYYVAITAGKNLINLNVSQKQNVGFSTTTAGPELWLVFISLVVLPPIAEEILFRGFLYTGLRAKWNKYIAALVTSVIFASLHLFESTNGQLLWIAGIDTFILSLVLVWLREKTDKLWASMGLHMIKNFIAFAGLFLFHVT